MSWYETAKIAKENANRHETRAAETKDYKRQAWHRREAVSWRATQRFAESVAGRAA